MLSPIFVDIEASGITKGCFPVEVGWAQAEYSEDLVRLHARSLLIRPTEDWRSEPARWVAASEVAHGISLDRLVSEGIAPEAACGELDAAFAGQVIATDGGKGDWDDDWSLMLYEAAGWPRPWDIAEATSGALIAAHLRDKRIEPRTIRPVFREFLPPHTHAAAEDALRFAWEWGMVTLLSTDPPNQPADLRTLISEARWPKLTAESATQMRRRWPA